MAAAAPGATLRAQGIEQGPRQQALTALAGVTGITMFVLAIL